jgi:DNA-binding transcriptional MerR regulator
MISCKEHQCQDDKYGRYGHPDQPIGKKLSPRNFRAFAFLDWLGFSDFAIERAHRVSPIHIELDHHVEDFIIDRAFWERKLPIPFLVFLGVLRYVILKNSAMDEAYYTVHKLVEMAGVSIRTLHYYDEIGLLKPDRVGSNKYRYYGEDALFRLQQILLYRDMDLSLQDIKSILEQPGFDPVEALRRHRSGIEARIKRLQGLLTTIDGTILHLTGAAEMSEHSLLRISRRRKRMRSQVGVSSASVNRPCSCINSGCLKSTTSLLPIVDSRSSVV